MSRVFSYSRVSTAEQVTSNQELEIKQAGYSVEPHRSVQEQISGSVQAQKRPAFQALLAKLEEGDTLVVTKLDRIGRDSIDVQQTVELFQTRKIKLVVLQLGNLDLTSTAGALMIKLLAAVADFERELIIERVQSGVARAKAEGKHMGRPSKTTSEQKQSIKASLSQGISVSAVAKEFNISRASVIAIRDTK
ncbi:recombinase family protein [Roseateles albus]|uniref:Recombinase family protein n=1 Tax=Roseateles albus TaxID=2987525 RepID=A0ABT5KFY4_9BURK|nr:recombinase family protein [Roseateles albus]MDC8772459.1 recombinase family protein [Roseateles albus]